MKRVIVFYLLLLAACASQSQKTQDPGLLKARYGGEARLTQSEWKGPVYSIDLDLVATGDSEYKNAEDTYDLIDLHMALVCEGRPFQQISRSYSHVSPSHPVLEKVVFHCMEKEDLKSLTYNREESLIERLGGHCSSSGLSAALEDACAKYKLMTEQRDIKAPSVARCKLPPAELKQRLKQEKHTYEKLEIYQELFATYLTYPRLASDDVSLAALADDALEAADMKPPLWLSGNVEHLVHLALGRVALLRGDISRAENELALAGQTRGSPQLNSFGPNMLLAKELAERGSFTAVIGYLEECGKFWRNEFGEKLLEEWKVELRNQRVPEFQANLMYATDRRPASESLACRPID